MDPGVEFYATVIDWFSCFRSGQYGVEVTATVIVGLLLMSSLTLAFLLFLRHRHGNNFSHSQVGGARARVGLSHNIDRIY